MPNPDPFFAAADRIAHDFYIKLWRFLYESRINPSTSNSMYWYNDMDTEEFSSNTQAPDTSPPPGSPDLEKYRTISQNHGLGPEPMIVEVILRLPQPSNIAKAGPLGLASSQMPQPIILETWKLSLEREQDDGLVGKGLVHHLVMMYEERRRFYWAIRICINKLPTEEFIWKINGPQTSPNLPMGLKIALRLSPGSANGIEEQFDPYGSAPLPILKYTFPPVPHAYGNFMLSVACITDSSRLLADLKLCVYRPSRLGIALSRNYLQINGQGESISGVSGKQAAAPKAAVALPDDRRQRWMEKPRPKLTPKKFLPPSGISKLRDRMMVNSADDWGEMGERKENFHMVSHKPDVTLDMEQIERLSHAQIPSTSRGHPGLMQSKNPNVSASCILPSYVNKFNSPTLSLVNADVLNTDKDVLRVPPDEPLPNSSSFRFGIPIPPKKKRSRDDYPNAQWWLKHMIHENLRSRRRAINSASTAGSRPSPMISASANRGNSDLAI